MDASDDQDTAAIEQDATIRSRISEEANVYEEVGAEGDVMQ